MSDDRPSINYQISDGSAHSRRGGFARDAIMLAVGMVLVAVPTLLLVNGLPSGRAGGNAKETEEELHLLQSRVQHSEGHVALLESQLKTANGTIDTLRAQQNSQTSPNLQTLTYLGVQQRLRSLGYKVGVPDGIWGSRSVTAIKTFQSGHGLPTTGELDEATIAALIQQR